MISNMSSSPLAPSDAAEFVSCSKSQQQEISSANLSLTFTYPATIQLETIWPPARTNEQSTCRFARWHFWYWRIRSIPKSNVSTTSWRGKPVGTWHELFSIHEITRDWPWKKYSLCSLSDSFAVFFLDMDPVAMFCEIWETSDRDSSTSESSIPSDFAMWPAWVSALARLSLK